MDSGMNKTLFSILFILFLPIALIVVITPMDSDKQYIFGLLSIGLVLLIGISKSRFINIVMVVMSFLMSSRYIYWRATETLHFNSVIEAALGIGLFLAELYAYTI
jgi:cellulose synthase (UDP-forming)